MRGGFLVLAAFLSLVLSLPSHAASRVALVIGMSNYQQVPKLSNPARDAAAMAGLFRQAGFDIVDSEQDLGIADLRRVVREFADKSRDADVAVVYYAGHGIEMDGNNYLIPADAKLLSDFDVQDETMSLDRVLKAIEPARRLKLIILDACRDNPFAKSMKRAIATRAIGRGLAEIEPANSDTLIAFAAKAGAVASDGDGQNSPFATALLKHLTEPGLDLRLAFGRVRDDVLKSTGNRQEPFVYGSLGGDTMALVPQKVDADAQAKMDYELAAQIGTKEAWDSFLARHGTGYFADLARAQAKKIGVGQDVRTKADAPAEKIATLEPSQSATQSTPAPPGAAVQMDPSDIARLLQAHLKRVGCISGTLDGTWDDSSRRALELFNKNAGTKFDVKLASLDALNVVRSRTDRVCPLLCGKNQKADGDRCVQIACRAGYVMTSSGECEKKPEPAPAPRAAARHESASPTPRSGGGGKCFSFNGKTYCE